MEFKVNHLHLRAATCVRHPNSPSLLCHSQSPQLYPPLRWQTYLSFSFLWRWCQQPRPASTALNAKETTIEQQAPTFFLAMALSNDFQELCCHIEGKHISSTALTSEHCSRPTALTCFALCSSSFFFMRNCDLIAWMRFFLLSLTCTQRSSVNARHQYTCQWRSITLCRCRPAES